jgi:hypothetical protein
MKKLVEHFNFYKSFYFSKILSTVYFYLNNLIHLHAWSLKLIEHFLWLTGIAYLQASMKIPNYTVLWIMLNYEQIIWPILSNSLMNQILFRPSFAIVKIFIYIISSPVTKWHGELFFVFHPSSVRCLSVIFYFKRHLLINR